MTDVAKALDVCTTGAGLRLVGAAARHVTAGRLL